ncbi:MAG: bifunctional adenosylcobinamide kinase/adenosylcobinamide-phosphate guanylyltransferase [Wujia sp.]
MIFVIGGAYQGKTEYVNESFGEEYEIVDDYQLVVKEQLRTGENPIERATELLENVLDKTVIISNELGAGLVPIDGFERAYREVNGRVNCLIAERAEQVIRVICGIGTRIK